MVLVVARAGTAVAAAGGHRRPSCDVMCTGVYTRAGAEIKGRFRPPQNSPRRHGEGARQGDRETGRQGDRETRRSRVEGREPDETGRLSAIRERGAGLGGADAVANKKKLVRRELGLGKSGGMPGAVTGSLGAL